VAAVPSIGRASRVERPVTPGADAAGDLYERYSAQILGYCMHQLGSREEAEDAVQTTFMNAFRGLQRGIVPELESAWLFKIAHNVCLSRRRSSWRRGKVEAPNNFEVLQEVIPGREQVADELIRLQDVLEEMPESQRRAILLREWQGLSYREISAELGVSQAAVETLIFRARRALAQGLEQDADTWKRRLRRGADAGGAVACIKALLSGGGAAALKVGATVMAVTTAAVATGSAPAPKQTHHAPAKRAVPAHVVRHVARPSTATRPAALAAAPASRRARAPRASAGDRSLPKPVALPASNPEETTSAPAALPPAPQESAPAPSPSEPPAPAATQPQTTVAPSPAASEPATVGNDGKKDNAERHPQAASPPPPEPVPAPPPAEPAEPIAQPNPMPPVHEDKSDRQDKAEKQDKPDNDKSDNGHGHGNGKK
jgi:RNA polymerase sigma factor (sigma-70 family)